MKISVDVLEKEKWYHTTKYEVTESYDLVGHTINEGFISDGASIPRWLTPFGLLVTVIGSWLPGYVGIFFVWFGVAIAIQPVIFPYVGKYLAAALLHDMLLGDRYGRRYCDDKFLEALKILGISKWRRYAMFSAVRIFSIAKN